MKKYENICVDRCEQRVMGYIRWLGIRLVRKTTCT